jgi:xanthine/CO dehydrogenase XdhC/CoxF family maturation factor
MGAVYNPRVVESRMRSDASDVLEQARRWRDEGRGVALATVVETWGSSPRPAGSLLALNDASAFVGSVSGGCIEAAVVDAGLGVIAEGAPRTLEFGVTNEMAWEVGLACGGRVRVFVERVE